jgi:hypothetical protein
MAFGLRERGSAIGKIPKRLYFSDLKQISWLALIDAAAFSMLIQLRRINASATKDAQK